MSCYHPLKAFVIGKKSNGKDELLIRDYDTEYVIVNGQTHFGYKEIPCGKCAGCRLEYSRQWANRMMLELEDHDEAWFVTLTYDDDHLPYNEIVTDDGCHIGVPTLRKTDLQKFFKRLRKDLDYPIRMFSAGEYGSNTLRPHYHSIIFGLHLDPEKLKPYKQTHTGEWLYTSEFLQYYWSKYKGNTSDNEAIKEPLGYVVVGRVNWKTCAYVARYVSKKMDFNISELIESYGMEAPFTLMSRHPGIGKRWFDSHPECMHYDFINLPTDDGMKKFRPPAYFEALYEKSNPEEYAEYKKRKLKNADDHRILLAKNLEKPYKEYLEDKERILLSKIKVLDRSEI